MPLKGTETDVRDAVCLRPTTLRSQCSAGYRQPTYMDVAKPEVS